MQSVDFGLIFYIMAHILGAAVGFIAASHFHTVEKKLKNIEQQCNRIESMLDHLMSDDLYADQLERLTDDVELETMEGKHGDLEDIGPIVGVSEVAE